MKGFAKSATILSLIGMAALAAPVPLQAGARPWAAGAGFVAGAAIGTVAAHASHDAYAYTPAYSYRSPDAYVAYEPLPPSNSNSRYLRRYHGYDTNYVGPMRERQLQGHDY